MERATGDGTPAASDTQAPSRGAPPPEETSDADDDTTSLYEVKRVEVRGQAG